MDTDINSGPLINSTVEIWFRTTTFQRCGGWSQWGSYQSVQRQWLPDSGLRCLATHLWPYRGYNTLKDNLGTVLGTGSGLSGAYTATFHWRIYKLRYLISELHIRPRTKLDGSALEPTSRFSVLNELVVIFNADTLNISVQLGRCRWYPLAVSTISVS